MQKEPEKRFYEWNKFKNKMNVKIKNEIKLKLREGKNEKSN